MKNNRVLIAIFIIVFCIYGIPLRVISTNERLSTCVTKTFDLHHNEWYEINSTTSINSNYVIEWSFTTSNPDVLIQVWAMDDPDFNNWKNSIDTTNAEHLISSRQGGSGYYSVPHNEIWHVVFMNFDTTIGDTTINAEINFIEEPTQNDCGIGQDAGNSYSASSQITKENFNGTGILIYDDQSDFYNFDVIAGKNLTITVSNFSDSYCNFVLYKQGGTKVVEEFDIIDEITIEYTIEETGICTFGISKNDTNDYSRVDYLLSIEFPTTTINTSIESKFIVGTISIISISLVIIRKRKKEKY